MEDKDSYTPEEVVEIAKHYANLREAMRYQLQQLILTTAINKAEDYAKKIPENVKRVFDLKDFSNISNVRIKEIHIDDLIRNVQTKQVRHFRENYRGL